MRLLITAGPTRESIDAVRYIGNRSSGKMGLALALAGDQAGHDVTLLLGPGPEAPRLSQGRVYRFESTAQLQQLIEAHFPDCRMLVMAAAVADYRPRQVVDGKLPRRPGQPLMLELEPTPDLVAQAAAARRPGQLIIAFALEEAAVLEERALDKLRRKGVDALVANPLGTMEADAITALWLDCHGRRDAPGRMSKQDFARWLIAKLGELSLVEP